MAAPFSQGVTAAGSSACLISFMVDAFPDATLKGIFVSVWKYNYQKKKNVTKFWYVGGLRLDYFLAMISSFLESQLFVWQQLIAEAHLCTHVVQDWKDSHE